MTGAKIDYLPNPRVEMPENQLRVENQQFLSLGLNPILLNDGLMNEIVDVSEKYRERCDRSKIPCRSKWRSDIDLGPKAAPDLSVSELKPVSE